ncbi:PREDICTED: probable ATP-dependent RNA helicase DDX31 isoform X2 [Nicrophorus vespilloides]|uniref:ATP-dependent RNA helicase n=1 Tax=Nicrophorus vespilloides TaxID=110193 RepID=A0ABM1N9G0_NICVS|nr:PREDICTED: probable ATP-dependent RNA helicase DDX31 isoform X2 [Nicrophorus vespilloides]
MVIQAKAQPTKKMNKKNKASNKSLSEELNFTWDKTKTKGKSVVFARKTAPENKQKKDTDKVISNAGKNPNKLSNLFSKNKQTECKEITNKNDSFTLNIYTEPVKAAETGKVKQNTKQVDSKDDVSNSFDKNNKDSFGNKSRPQYPSKHSFLYESEDISTQISAFNSNNKFNKYSDEINSTPWNKVVNVVEEKGEEIKKPQNDDKREVNEFNKNNKFKERKPNAFNKGNDGNNFKSNRSFNKFDNSNNEKGNDNFRSNRSFNKFDNSNNEKGNDNFRTNRSFNQVDNGNNKGNDGPEEGEEVQNKREYNNPLANSLLKLSGTNEKLKKKSYKLFTEKAKDVYVDLEGGKSVSEKVFTSSKFSDLSLNRHVVSNLEKINFKDMTNVQQKSIPVIMSGKNTLVRSQTGSGKTLTYAVPIIDALQGLQPALTRSDGVQAIIVVPTRELALQTHELVQQINTFQRIIVGHLCGGENRKSEKDRIRKGINVLVGTPGRLLDHVLHTSALKVDKVRCLVLDEADRLLDMGFRKDIISLVEALDKAKTDSVYDPMAILKGQQNNVEETIEEPESDDVPPLLTRNTKRRQTILLSATLSKGVSELAEFTMKDHTYIDALDQNSNAVMDSFVIPNTVKQEFIITYVKHRLFTLSALLVAKAKENAKVFVFMASTQMVEYHYELFTQCLAKMPVKKNKIDYMEQEVDSDGEIVERCEEEVVLDTPFFALHGSMDQKRRKDVFTSFRAAKTGILLCTDVVARGVDVPLADCIIQYTGPQTDEDYLHRVGRTGRAGKSGTAILFLTHDEQEYVNHLRQHRVYLQKREPQPYLNHLSELMGVSNHEIAASMLQQRYEKRIEQDVDLHKRACMAYSTWSRFYNAYPAKMRSMFDFKKIHLGHYVTSFAIKDTPKAISQVVRGHVGKIEQPRLNKKLANHGDYVAPMFPKKETAKKKAQKIPRTVSLETSEFSSGLEPLKKKRKRELD